MKRLVWTAVAALALVGCGADSPEKQLASAKEYLQKKDPKAAIIQIKNVLQQQPESGEARFLLGSTLLGQGDVVAAEVELRKALAARHPSDEVIPELARAMLMLGQSNKVVAEFGSVHLGKPTAEASLQTSLAMAYAALDKRDESQSALDAALASDSSYAPAQLLLARRKAAAQDVEGALATVDAVVRSDPNDSAAWILKGDLLQFGKGDAAGALEAYRKAVGVAPDSFAARSALVAGLIRTGSLDEATQQIEQAKKLAPGHPSTKYMEATLAFQKKDFKTTRELTRQLLQLAPKDPRVLQMAGAAELYLGSPAQAEIYLTRATQIAPNLPLARRLLIVSYLRTGQAPKALAALNAMDPKRDFDAAMYALAGEVYLQNGDAKKAEEAFAQSLKLDPADARKRTALAVTHLASGRAEAALDELQEIAEADTGAAADMALISAHLRRKEFDKALAAVDRLEKKQPDKPLAANLRGRIQMLQKDPANARKGFERALSIDPGFFPAIASLAALDVADKRPAEAKKRFEALLAKDPKNVQALVALAQLAAADPTAKDEALAWLKKAVEAAPTNPAPRLMLIEAYARANDNKQALAAAQSAVTAIPDSNDLLIALGRMQQVTGDVNQAIATYSKAVAAQPLSPAPLLRLAEAQLVAKDSRAAEQSLRKALEIKPDDLDAQRGLITILVSEKKYPDAIAIARLVQSQRPKQAFGWVFEGDIAAARKDSDAAIAAYRSGLKQVQAPVLAMKLHAALMDSGKTAEAERYAASWEAAKPNDTSFPAYLGSVALARKDYAAAAKHYAAVVKIQPNNALALNNMAWAEQQAGIASALEHAQRANELVPNQPAFMDTLATILSARGEHDKAVALQQKAVGLQPANQALKLNLARFYLAAGDKSKARTELETLAKLDEKNPVRAEAQALLAKM